MELEQIQVGFMVFFLIWLPVAAPKEALLIDPGGNEEELVEHIQRKGLDLEVHREHPWSRGSYLRQRQGEDPHGCKDRHAPLDDKLFNSRPEESGLGSGDSPRRRMPTSGRGQRHGLRRGRFPSGHPHARPQPRGHLSPGRWEPVHRGHALRGRHRPYRPARVSEKTFHKSIRRGF